MPVPVLRTSRLTLVAASAELLGMELEDRETFGQALGAAMPASWPPPLYERANMHWSLAQLKRDPALHGWLTWFWLLNREPKPLVIGLGGFKGKPNASGAVEIGYNVLPEFQRQGLATEAVGALVEWTFRQPKVERVIAKTLPELPASIRVLRKCGFEFAGNDSDIEVLRFERKRGNQ
jgi:ribosomal-protein-alanine N-acetyltransferase